MSGRHHCLVVCLFVCLFRPGRQQAVALWWKSKPWWKKQGRKAVPFNSSLLKTRKSCVYYCLSIDFFSDKLGSEPKLLGSCLLGLGYVTARVRVSVSIGGRVTIVFSVHIGLELGLGLGFDLGPVPDLIPIFQGTACLL